MFKEMFANGKATGQAPEHARQVLFPRVIQSHVNEQPPRAMSRTESLLVPPTEVSQVPYLRAALNE